MIRHCVVIATAGLLTVGARSASSQSAQASLVDVHGHKLNVVIGGTTKAGVPTVVFSNGLGAPIALWNDVKTDLDSVTRTIAYDRGGTFGSGPMTEAPTIKQIVNDLHELLLKVDARPPYVLVGHSYGGVIIHSFAALYRSEVVGLVYVDPTDFTQTAEDERAVLEKGGVKGGRNGLAKMKEQAVRGAPSGIVAEDREIDRAEAGGFAEFRADGERLTCPRSCCSPAERNRYRRM
jgi:pimeloyl-ACP methyl ester carboxylesterase